MSRRTPGETFALALFVCGTLDIVWAAGTTMIEKSSVMAMLRGIASGPFGDGVNDWGPGTPMVGIIVHFAIMAVMVAVYAALIRRPALARVPWWLLGLGYGALLYVVMYRIAMPLRWPEIHPLRYPGAIAWTLAPHLICVGLPLAWIYRGGTKAPRKS